jgi:hypothetical protein
MGGRHAGIAAWIDGPKYLWRVIGLDSRAWEGIWRLYVKLGFSSGDG